MRTNWTFPALLESFFTERLMQQKNASEQTIAAYRDTFHLFLTFLKKRLRREPSAVEIEQLNASLIFEFLDHLENERGNSIRTRNHRLAVIRSFFRYVSFQEPKLANQAGQILEIPVKRWKRVNVSYLTAKEVDALLRMPDCGTCSGCRDHALLMFAVETGLRASELVGLKCKDIILGTGAHVSCQGKGRKERCVPLGKSLASALRSWLRERQGQPEDALFPNARGGFLSRDGLEYIIRKHITLAQKECPSLRKKRVSPHVLRHTTAVRLLEAGVDRAVIALWLGHESVETTQIYMDASLKFKEKILAKVPQLKGRRKFFRADDRLLEFLRGL
ncbi:MAG TPA: integrase [Gammaproteobacteria bacterium]|nr:integrase [Gammaproteobacteria bacterium]